MKVYIIRTVLHRLHTGKYETINGVRCYVASPKGDYAKDKVVLFLTDIFGLELINNRVRTRLLLPGLTSTLTMLMITLASRG
jgi:hypothetical protein